MPRDLESNELELRGRWVLDGGQIIEDEVCERTEWLIGSRLEPIASDSTGWTTLYRDPASGRLWERLYPEGGWHGGGPPLLRAISDSEAKSKYDVTE